MNYTVLLLQPIDAELQREGCLRADNAWARSDLRRSRSVRICGIVSGTAKTSGPGQFPPARVRVVGTVSV